MKTAIDKIDSQIVRLLQKNGRLPNTEIAKSLGISESTIRTRLNRLISKGVISITAIGNPACLGFDVIGIFMITIDHKKTDSVIEELNKIHELWYIAHTAGAADFFIEFSVKSLAHLDRLLSKIHSIEGIKQVNTSFLRKNIRASYGWWPDGE
ncbi:MAG: Lrp/AsnC family transcriptional regulator [Deltaproteobacteria bacterium]|nr:Lrp/AsnC family transcriptional regulator [Deltaproteobacteria bacterium]